MQTTTVFQTPAVAEAYAKGRKPLSAQTIRYVRSLLPLVQTGKVLELGTGTGLTAGITTGLGFTEIGCDLSEAMLRKRPPGLGPCVLCDAGRLPFAEGSFDAAFGVRFIHWIPDLDALLRELRRVLRPGGMVTFVNQHELGPMVDESRAVLAGFGFRPQKSGRKERDAAGPLRSHGFVAVRSFSSSDPDIESYDASELRDYLSSVSWWDDMPAERKEPMVEALLDHFQGQMDRGFFRRPLRTVVISAMRP